MQVFQKKDAVLCGIDEAIAVLKLASGHYTDLRAGLQALRPPDRTQAPGPGSHFLNDRKTYLQVLKQKLEIAQQLDSALGGGLQRSWTLTPFSTATPSRRWKR